MDQKMIEKLFATRRGYVEDCQREKFHLDAYAGTGGFAGAVRAAASSFWGWAADAYSDSGWFTTLDLAETQIDTYLDRFDREDGKKFERRVRVVHYENHVEPCVDIPLSYLRRKPLIRTGGGKPLQEWEQDATGDGVSWDTLVTGDVLLRGAVTGMCPVMFDLPKAEPRADGTERTRADDEAEGRTVRAIPLFGLNLLDYGEDDHGGIEWAKVRFDYVDRADPLGEAVHRIEIRILTKDTIRLIELVCDKGGKKEVIEDEEIANPFGVVPLAIFRPKPMPGDPVRGISTIQNIASESRRLFNLHSELDEHIRKSVFAFLQVPSKTPARAGRVVVGNSAALTIDPESKQGYAWISPSQDVSNVLERRAENTVSAIYAMARLAFVRGSIISAAASGISRQYEFESTNRAVSDMAAELAKFDQAGRRIAARVLEPTTPEDEIRTTAPGNFGIDDLDAELARLEAASRGRFGGVFMAEARRRVVAKLLPNMTDEVHQAIDAEIVTLAESETRAQAQSDAMADMGGAFPAGGARGAGEETEVPVADASIEAVDDVTGGVAAAPALAKDPSANLNGAQVQALQGIVEAVAAGTLPKESGVAIITTVFQITEKQARAIMEPIVPKKEHGTVSVRQSFTGDVPAAPAFAVPER